jgi:hypothetical protein
VSATPDEELNVATKEPPQIEAEEVPEEDASPSQADVSAGEDPPPEVEHVPVPDTQADVRIREIPGAAGHGPARAYGYIAVASALGVQAELTEGGTRSTSARPLRVTVHADPETFERINDLYDTLAPEAERVAAARRTEARKDGRRSYELSLLTRAVLAGFPQGAASALREPGTTKPVPFREATRARLIDSDTHLSAISVGRAWAVHNLVPASASA